MTMMEICSDPEYQQQISKLSQDYQVASRIRKAGESARLGLGIFKPSSKLGNGSFTFLPGNEKDTPVSDRLSAPPTQWSSEALAAPSTFPPERKLSDGKHAATTPKGPAATNERWRRQSPGGNKQAQGARSDGEFSEGGSIRSPPPEILREGASLPNKGTIAASGNTPHSQVLPLNSASLSCIPELFPGVTGKEPSLEARDADAERRSVRGEFKTSSKLKSLHRKKTNSLNGHSKKHCSVHTPEQRTRTDIPTRDDLQGPSPVDQNLMLEAKFPEEMVLEMQSAAAKKARRTVIKRTLGGGEHPSKLSTNA
jgi:hypothetical protein